MTKRNYISETFFLFLADLITGYRIHKDLKFLMKSQYWTSERIENYQNEKLKLLIEHSYDNVPFYRELFDELKLKPRDIQTKDDLYKLPIITKEMLKNSKGKNFARNTERKQLIFSSSSGSTGEPFQYYCTKLSDSMLKAAAIRGWSWMGYSLGDLYVKISMNPRSSVLKKIQDYVNNSRYLSSNQLNEIEFKRIIDEVFKIDPSFIRCYPVPLFYLASQIENKYEGFCGKNLKAINTTGSTLSEEVRQKIEEVFKVKVFDSYSCEGGAMFFECPAHGFYHPSQEYAIQEFVEDSFTFADPEHPVRHITTDLHNFASPFIRYDTQDYLVLGDRKKCNCGREMLNIKKIKGRDSDVLITPSGKYLIVENFVAYFEWITEVEQIQVVQEKINEIIINLVVNEYFNSYVYDKILNYWSDYIGTDVIVVLKVVTMIQLTPTGKRRTVIRNPNIKIDGRS